MKTLMLLMAQYNAQAIIPIEQVCQDYFPHLTPKDFARKVGLGEIRLPMIRIENSQKATKGVHLEDLATYLDQRRQAALKESQQLWPQAA